MDMMPIFAPGRLGMRRMKERQRREIKMAMK
jgi:hypothetical protein